MGRSQAIKIIKRFVKALKKEGISIDRVILYGSYARGKVRDFVGDGSRFELRVGYSFEPELLGTAGAVKNMEAFFDRPCLWVA